VFPSNDEYEYTNFPDYKDMDITSISSNLGGSPYGGYARATRSRLSNLPIRLVGNGQFDELKDENEEEERKSEKKEHYFNVRDGQGRLFACRVYHEDELHNSNDKSSMFDEAHEKKYNEDGKLIRRDDPNIATNVPPEKNNNDKESLDKKGDDVDEEDEDDAINVPKNEEEMRNTLSSILGELGVEDAAEQLEAGESLILNEDVAKQLDKALHKLTDQGITARNEESLKAHIDGMTKKPKIKKKKKEKTMVQLEKTISHLLKGVCARVHQGYWSYKWCHEGSFEQYHVAQTRSSTSVRTSIESVINLGHFKGQTLNLIKDSILHSTPKKRTTVNMNNDAEKVSEEDEPSSAILRQVYDMGDYCEEAKVNRQITVEVRCCDRPFLPNKLEQQLRQAQYDAEILSQLPRGRRRNREGAMLSKGAARRRNMPTVTLMDVKEDRGQLCHYKADVCAPLLCSDNISHLQIKDGIVDVVDENDAIDNHDDDYGQQTKDGTFFAKRQNNKIKQKVVTPRKIVGFLEDETIEEMLDRTLKVLCLQRNDGWWKYEFCHGRHTRQFHSDTIGDSTGRTTTTIDDDYRLGEYNQEAAYTKPTKELEQTLIVDAYTPNAYYSMEYTGGQVCDDADVTDSAVKGGDVDVEGGSGIERATTVRFYCGKKGHNLYRVDEDSTCHYVFYVKVPELCMHELFKVPVLKEQVVKCLPVDDRDEEQDW